MCTATYIPKPHNGFVLTHSRDEKTIRPAAQLPQMAVIGRQEVVFPKDPQSGGTWIATSAHQTVCLLNGGLVAHRPAPPYRHSRGLVPLQVFGYQDTDAFLEHYTPQDLEPFTLILAQPNRLLEFRWTGQHRLIQELSPRQPHIWSSATLYDPSIRQQREHWFHTWLHTNPAPGPEAIRQFHLHAGETDSTNAIRMNRNNELMTLSLTRIIHQPTNVEVLYDDLIHQKTRHLTLHPLQYATA